MDAVPGGGVNRGRGITALAVAGLAAVAACEHAQPFGLPPAEPNVPYEDSFPRQLTYNLLGDVQPAWLPGDSEIVYSLSAGPPDNTHCLGILPASGGHLLGTICHPVTFGGDSTTALWSPAASAGGNLAYLREVSTVEAVTPDSADIVLARVAVPDPGRILVRLPYLGVDSTLRTGVRELHWLNDGVLVFLAGTTTYSYPPYPWDTTFTPVEIGRVSIQGDSTQRTVVPGTTGAVAVTADSDGVMYYALAGDSRVYRLLDGAPQPTVWYDFGALGAPTQIDVAQHVLVGLVNDSLYAVHVGAGSPIHLLLPDSMQVEGIALNRAGTRLVVAGDVHGLPPDLWLVEVP
jgi:hypothetical protein